MRFSSFGMILPCSGGDRFSRAHTGGVPRSMLARQIRDGLGRNEFGLNYQPIWHIGSRSVAGVECLLRWQHPTRGLLMPGMFHEALSDKAVARDVFDFVLDRACRELSSFDSRWQVAAPRMAINVDASVLADQGLSERIAAAARRHGVNPCMLDLEVVETNDASGLLSSGKCTIPLRVLGIRLLCDDFGVANPPLSTLSMMRIDGIKLDKEFLRDVPRSRRGGAVLKSMLELCRELKLRVIAEGVETEEQFDWLAGYGNVEVQGFFVAAPQLRFADVWSNLFKAASGEDTERARS